MVMFSCSHVLSIQNDVTNNENKALHSDMDYSNANFRNVQRRSDVHFRGGLDSIHSSQVR